MLEDVPSPYLVSFDGSFRQSGTPTRAPSGAAAEDECRERLEKLVEELDDLQQILYADDRVALLLVFQALDAAGKDGTIRAILRGVNPVGCQVFSFKQPTPEELDHDFLWRTSRRLPERGRIGVFNRSYYEEVLVVRVHPDLLKAQRLPGPTDDPIDPERIWQERYESIREHEAHLARNGTLILKFWLNVSREEQRRRFLSRLEEPHKNWKFSASDVRERDFWDDYMRAYEGVLRATSRPWAPWFAVPADDKPFMRMCVAEIVVRSLRSRGLGYPAAEPGERPELAEMRRLLERPS